MSEKTHRILIVDDERFNIKVLNDLLKPAYRTMIAKNGKQALDVAFSDIPPDLILLDIMMPEMDGYEVCTRLKADERTQDIPVIFVTAMGEVDDEAKGLEIGAVDYIVKPFHPPIVLARVKTHLCLKEKNEQLQALNASKDTFFSIISHDLRSPLAASLGYSELLQTQIEGGAEKDEQQTTARKLHLTIKHLHSLLENLLTWSRIQLGAMQYDPEELELREIAEYNLDLFISKAEQKQICLECAVQDDVMVYADYNMLNTVIRNLVSNALKFTPSAGTITISARRHDERFCEMAVSDTGDGINEADIPKLFRIDMQHSTVGTAGEKGTGLGLSLCQDLVQKNGGKIWVESEQDMGTTFKLTLPIPQ